MNKLSNIDVFDTKTKQLLQIIHVRLEKGLIRIASVDGHRLFKVQFKHFKFQLRIYNTNDLIMLFSVFMSTRTNFSIWFFCYDNLYIHVFLSPMRPFLDSETHPSSHLLSLLLFRVRTAVLVLGD